MKKGNVKEELMLVRFRRGLLAIKEISSLFGISRASIDFMVNTGQLKYISPNGRTRFIWLKDYLTCIGLVGEEADKYYQEYLMSVEKKGAIVQVCDTDNDPNRKSAF